MLTTQPNLVSPRQIETIYGTLVISSYSMLRCSFRASALKSATLCNSLLPHSVRFREFLQQLSGNTSKRSS